jgi:ArsR family transcriptional regulator
MIAEHVIPARAAERCAETIIDEDKVRRAEQVLLDGLQATHLADMFKALADPTRLRIVSILAHTELCVCDLAATLGMTQSAVSHQLQLMRRMRLVKNRKDGRMVYYMLDDEHVQDLFQRGLEHVKHKD